MGSFKQFHWYSEPVVLVVSGMRAGSLCAVATGDRAIRPTAPTMPLAVCLTKGRQSHTTPHRASKLLEASLHIENDKKTIRLQSDISKHHMHLCPHYSPTLLKQERACAQVTSLAC
eukprot:5177924-Amphidinium_carterae.1